LEIVAVNTSYNEILENIKETVKQSQFKAMVVVNRELIVLYWQIGKTILSKQNEQGWDSKIIEKLSADLSLEFPNMKGFSSRNLMYMRKFAETYPDFEFVHQVGAQLPWRQLNRFILNPILP
jgi:predicted nuclease of restriction endonuclease-like (RecB) superfamily